MHEPRSRRPSLLVWAGSICCALAVAVVTIPGIGFVTALVDDGVRLGNGAVSVDLEPGKSYGIYVNDADNSGYSEDCSVVDAQGQQVPLKFPPWSISSSDTENLDRVFNSGSGKLTISCDAPGEQVTTRLLPDYSLMLFAFVAAGVLGVAGLGLFSAWYAAQPSRGSTFA